MIEQEHDEQIVNFVDKAEKALENLVKQLATSKRIIESLRNRKLNNIPVDTEIALQTRIFDLEIALDTMVTLNKNMNEQAAKDNATITNGYKKIQQLGKELKELRKKVAREII